MSTFFSSFLCCVRHWCDYIGIRRGALYNSFFRLDLVFLSLTRIVSTSTHYHLNCHRIEPCDAISDFVQAIYKNGDGTLWRRHIFMAIHSIGTMKLWFHSSMLIVTWMRFTIDGTDCIICAILFSHLKNLSSTRNLCKFSTMHFSWTLNGFNDFSKPRCKKKKSRKKWTEWKSILLGIHQWTNRVRPKIFIMSLSRSWILVRTFECSDDKTYKLDMLRYRRWLCRAAKLLETT